MIDKKSARIDDYIFHMIEAIERIENYTAGLDEILFAANLFIQDAVIRNIEIVGEAANNIKVADDNFAKQHPQLKLEQAYRMRNALAHGYYSVNITTVWNTVTSDLPRLKEQFKLLASPRR